MLHPLITVPASVGTVLTLVLLVTSALEQASVPAVAGVATAVTTCLTVLSQYITIKVKAKAVAKADRAAGLTR